MPWKIVSNHSGCPASKPFGVVVKDGGKKVGCHVSRAKAAKQIAALNASENKMTDLKQFEMNGVHPSEVATSENIGLAATTKQAVANSTPIAPVANPPAKVWGEEEKEEKSIHSPVDWLPFGVTSFSELERLESAREAAFEIAEKSHLFPQMVENIMADENIIDKNAAVEKISKEFGEFVKEKTSEVNIKSKMSRFGAKLSKMFSLPDMKTPNDKGGLVIWKQGDKHRFLAIYSNNYIDRDIDIISAKSHERFVEMVDSGEYPMPVLRHFHVAGTEWGQVEMVHYDQETGFAIAAGVVLPGHEHEAEAVGEMEDIAMSHGMLKSTLKRDSDDDRIITEHETIEISDLPLEVASNQLTNFHIIKEAEIMTLTQEKKDYLKAAGVKNLDGLEKSLVDGKTLAESLGLESKSEGDDATEEIAPVAAPVETPAEVPAEAVPIETPPVVAPAETPVAAPAAPPAVEPVAPVAPVTPEAPAASPADDAPADEVLAAGFSDTQTKQLVEALSLMMDTFEKKIDIKLAPVFAGLDAIVSAEDELLSLTPAASIQDMIINKKYLGNMSALTSPETVMDKRTRLAKDAPKETEKAAPMVTASGNPLLDHLTANLVRPDWADQFEKKPELTQIQH